MTTAQRILLLSAYDTPSHQYWREGLVKHFQQYQWTHLSLPARYFSWRVRGNSLTWGMGDYPELTEHYDLIIATSMVDITALRGFRPNLTRTPLIVYFHENQFDYPLSAHQREDISMQMTSIYNALCSDRLVFNSQYNRQTFIEGARRLLDKMPDHVPSGLIDLLVRKSLVIPVALDIDSTRPLCYSAGEKLKILWNHRWEYDKNPEAFFMALEHLKAQGVPFELSVVGQQFRRSPDIFATARKTFSSEIVAWGYQSRADYEAIIKRCNLVISTSWHDFQGLSVQQAIANGCVALCPNRVAYPEYLPEALLYSIDRLIPDAMPRLRDSSQTHIELEATELSQKMASLFKTGFSSEANPVEPYQWSELKTKYSELIEQTLNMAYHPLANSSELNLQ